MKHYFDVEMRYAGHDNKMVNGVYLTRADTIFKAQSNVAKRLQVRSNLIFWQSATRRLNTYPLKVVLKNDPFHKLNGCPYHASKWWRISDVADNSAQWTIEAPTVGDAIDIAIEATPDRKSRKPLLSGTEITYTKVFI